MKKLLLILALPIFFLISAQAVKAQYNTAIGARLGPYLGLTVKHNINDKAAIEGIVETRYRGFWLTGLYEYHLDLGVDGLRLYVGGGAHIAYWTRPVGNTQWGSVDRGGFFGLDGIIGLEYTFDGAPINISLDYKPTYNFGASKGLGYDSGALSIRYAF